MLEPNFEEADGQGICNGFSEDLPKLGLLNQGHKWRVGRGGNCQILTE